MSDEQDAVVDQSEDAGVVHVLTDIVREADAAFQRVGGSSRHWVRDCFLPTLNAHGAIIAFPRCAHCGEELLKMDGEWVDRETHGSCDTDADSPVLHAPTYLPIADAHPEEPQE